MKTIVYIGGELPDKDASALRITANALAIKENGYKVKFISQNRNLQKGCLREYWEGFEIIYLPYPKGNKEWFMEYFSASVYIDEIKNTEDVYAVVCYNFHAVAMEILIKYCHSNGIKVYADSTEWHTVDHLHGIKKIIKRADEYCRIMKTQKHCDGVICISSYFQNIYSNFTKTILVPPLVDLNEKKWGNKIDNGKRITHFVYAGRVGIGKDNLYRIIQAFLNISMPFVFDVVGVELEEYIAHHPDHVMQIKDNTKINFRGYVPHEQALLYVKNADYSIIIRNHNRKNDSGFPTKLPESVTCGTPVIANDFSDVKYYINKYNLGIFVEDINDLENTIKYAISMPAKELQKLKDSCGECTAFDYHTYIDDFSTLLS